MGGFGSGRHYQWGAKNLTTALLSIDVRRWARGGYLEPGRCFSWKWSSNGEKVADIKVWAEAGQVRLIYKSRSGCDDWEDYDYPVRLRLQRCNFGGFRHWFICPAQGCGRSVALLYGGSVFACRQCHDLAYPSQREEAHLRAQRKAEAIRDRLGWYDGEDLFGPRPKGMHKKTFDRLRIELMQLDDEADALFYGYVMQRFGHLAD